mmetsp:Transcript_40527/g.72532  ORF Transcript_40527/g.72532 Transcript_40527/m.72532 type:complete len:234 (-) Transcript_40527:28-729(-)
MPKPQSKCQIRCCLLSLHNNNVELANHLGVQNNLNRIGSQLSDVREHEVLLVNFLAHEVVNDICNFLGSNRAIDLAIIISLLLDGELGKGLKRASHLLGSCKLSGGISSCLLLGKPDLLQLLSSSHASHLGWLQEILEVASGNLNNITSFAQLVNGPVQDDHAFVGHPFVGLNSQGRVGTSGANSVDKPGVGHHDVVLGGDGGTIQQAQRSTNHSQRRSSGQKTVGKCVGVHW